MPGRPIARPLPRGRVPVVGALVLLTVLPVTAAARSCEPVDAGWSAGVEAGAVRYAVAGGVTGVEWGPDLARTGGRVAGRVGYRRVELRDARATPHLVRGSLSAGVGAPLGVRLCATLHAGGSRFSGGGDHGSVLAGGAGVAATGRILVGNTPVFPYVELRGLAARSDGVVLDTPVQGTGLSLGAEAGAAARLGRLLLRATASADGFAGGLGVSPYAGQSVRLGAHYPF